VRFWLTECRTQEILQVVADKFPQLAREMVQERPLLGAALAGDSAMAAHMLQEEEDQDRELDRRYWTPLKEELERWRRH